jgi:hypothetical protein
METGLHDERIISQWTGLLQWQTRPATAKIQTKKDTQRIYSYRTTDGHCHHCDIGGHLININ